MDLPFLPRTGSLFFIRPHNVDSRTMVEPKKRNSMFHFICFSFQAARLITLVIMSLNASKSSSYAVMGLDIVNALLGMACTAYIMYMCKVNPRRIVPNKVCLNVT